jgi:hypothetical protein
VGTNRLRNALIGIVVACPVAIFIFLAVKLVDLGKPNGGISGFLGAYLVAVLTTMILGIPFAWIAAWRRSRSGAGVPKGPRQRLTHASIYALAAAALLGWVTLGIARSFHPGLDGTIAMSFLMLLLYSVSGILAIAGKGAGRGTMLIAFGLIALAAVVGFLVGEFQHSPAVSY